LDSHGRVDWSRFGNAMSTLIRYRSHTTRVPINASSWEELIHAVLVYMEHDVAWEEGSHKPGVDLAVRLNGHAIGISAKAGKLQKTGFSVSSYRLTRFARLDEMLQFLADDAAVIDCYLICVRSERTNSIDYAVCKLSGTALVPAEFALASNWEETSQAWVLKDEVAQRVGFSAQIVKKMSNQLWYKIPTDLAALEMIAHLTIPRADLAKLLYEVLRQTEDPSDSSQ
jgi:hypothetical protein